jgi:hypothetical protein
MHPPTPEEIEKPRPLLNLETEIAIGVTAMIQDSKLFHLRASQDLSGD